MEGRCPACGHLETKHFDSAKTVHDRCVQCGFRFGPRQSELSFCHCEKALLKQMKSHSSVPLTCARCNGFLRCEFCTEGGRHQPGLPIAFFVFADKLVCPEHVWRAGVEGSQS